MEKDAMFVTMVTFKHALDALAEAALVAKTKDGFKATNKNAFNVEELDAGLAITMEMLMIKKFKNALVAQDDSAIAVVVQDNCKCVHHVMAADAMIVTAMGSSESNALDASEMAAIVA